MLQRSKPLPIQLIFISLLSFIMNPILGIFITSIIIINKVSLSFSFKLLFLFISTYLALIVTTKSQESDLLHYADIFFNSKNHSLISYLNFYGKEFIFFMMSYFSYYVFDGNFDLYIILFMLCIYLSIYRGIYSVYFNKIPFFLLLLLVFYVSSLRGIFFASHHLIRQILAFSIVIYFISTRYYTKPKYYLLLIAFFVHTSSISFILISLLPKINKLFSIKFFLYFISACALLYSTNNFILLNIENIPFLGYITNRIFDVDSLFNSSFESLTFFEHVTSFVFLALALYLTLFNKKFPKQSYILNTYILYFILTYVFLLVLDNEFLFIRNYLNFSLFYPFIIGSLLSYIYISRFKLAYVFYVLFFLLIFVQYILFFRSIEDQDYDAVFELILNSVFHFLY